jgi:hypothetical protein
LHGSIPISSAGLRLSHVPCIVLDLGEKRYGYIVKGAGYATVQADRGVCVGLDALAMPSAGRAQTQVPILQDIRQRTHALTVPACAEPAKQSFQTFGSRKLDRTSPVFRHSLRPFLKTGFVLSVKPLHKLVSISRRLSFTVGLPLLLS